MKRNEDLEKVVEEKNDDLNSLRYEKSLVKELVNNIMPYTMLEGKKT